MIHVLLVENKLTKLMQIPQKMRLTSASCTQEVSPFVFVHFYVPLFKDTYLASKACCSCSFAFISRVYFYIIRIKY